MISKEDIKEWNKASEEIEKIAHINELVTEEMNARIKETAVHTSRMQEASKALAENPGPETMVQSEEILKQGAIQMLHYSGKMEEYVQQLEVHVDLLVETLPAFLNSIRNAETEKERDIVAALRQSSSNLLESCTSGKAAFRDNQDSLSCFQGINRDWDDARRRLAEIIGRFIHIAEKEEAFFRKILFYEIRH